jgi:hypothetical protein
MEKSALIVLLIFVILFLLVLNVNDYYESLSVSCSSLGASPNSLIP